MIKSVSRLNAMRSRVSSLVRFSSCAGLGIILLASVAATSPTTAQSPDEQYIHIMSIIDRADALRVAGQADAAHVKYLEAEKALLQFKSANPLFEPKTVAYRLKEVTDRADVRPALPEATNSAAKMNLEAAAPAAKSNVKLLEAGADPKTVLRYHVKPGDKQSAIMTWKTKSEGVPIPGAAAAGPGGMATTNVSTPEVSIPIDYAVQSIAANGDVNYTVTFGDATVAQDTNASPESVQQLQTLFASLKGASMNWLKTSRGATKRMDSKTSGSTNLMVRSMVDQFAEALDMMNVELPAEAVGKGAKWESKSNTKVQTATLSQTSTFELVSADGDKLGTKFEATLEASTGSSKTTGTQIGGNASGTVNVDLSKLVGSSTKLTLHLELPVGKGQVIKTDAAMGLDAQ